MAGQNQNDNTMTTVLVMVAIMIAAFIIKNFFGNDIMNIFLQLKMLIVKGYLHIFNTEGLRDAYDKIDIYTPKEWNYSAYADLSGSLRLYISIPLLLILIPYGYKVYKKNPLNKYKRTMNRQSLCESEVGLWPWIAPVLKVDIISMPIDEGPWAMTDIPLVFCRKYNLLNEKNIIQKDKARKVFISQLGPLWTGIENLKPQEKAILACFLAQLNLNQKDAIKGLSLMSTTIAEGNIDYSFADGYIKKYAYTEKSEKFLNKNAYVYNVIATVFEECKKYGKIPPSYFLWLKVVDRNLFYTLHCVGRKLPFPEVGGIFGHGLAEKVIARKCISPYVDKAVEGLEEALTHVKII
jgi:intracellular multiplication protein IcmP